jgi:hypothetical protein
MYVTLINNKRVTKTAIEPEKVDASQTSEVTVVYKGSKSVSSVKEIYADAALENIDNKTTLTLPAGGMAVLEIQLK